MGASAREDMSRSTSCHDPIIAEPPKAGPLPPWRVNIKPSSQIFLLVAERIALRRGLRRRRWPCSLSRISSARIARAERSKSATRLG
jgi:hypothetical protein